MTTTALSFEATEKKNLRRYIVELTGAMVVYAIALTASMLVLKRFPTAPGRYLVALIPVLPMMAVPIVVLRFVRRADELWRQIHLEALAFAFPLGLLLTSAYGFLQIAGLPGANWTWIWPVFGACWALGLTVARARYK
jgi:hypothetical protein